MNEERRAEDRLSNHMLEEERRLTRIEEDIKDLTTKISSLETNVSDLVTAWKTAGNVVSFVKWLASIATAVVAIVAFFKLGIVR